MSYVSLDFLKDNFLDQKIVFFDIGCCNLWDTKDFVSVLPDATFYAFEPLKDYYEINLVRSVEYGVNFFNYAMSDVDGEILFYPSVKQGEQEQLQSSSIFKPTIRNVVSYGEPYLVKSVTIESFCKEHNLSPDFIHIDVEGAEELFEGAVQTYGAPSELVIVCAPENRGHWGPNEEIVDRAIRIGQVHSFDQRAKELVKSVQALI
jgi:FkbM family methyltransferase